MPQPDPTAIEQWLGRLYDHFDEGEWLTLFALDRSDGSRYVDWLDIGDYDAIVDRAFKRAERCDVWHGVATRRARQLRGRGTAADCANLPGLWVDVDIAGPGHKVRQPLPPDVDAARGLLAGFGFEPSAVVHSGGGLQAWYLFEEPLDATEGATLLARWGATWARLGRERGWHVDNVFDIARIMRLPGTLNRKLDEPRPVVVIEHCEARYGVVELLDLLDELPTPPEHAGKTPTPHIGPERPGDAYNARHTAGDVLKAHGWTLAGTERNGDEQWTRPGKETREGSSATVYTAEDGHCTVWSDTAAAMFGLDVRRPYDAFALFAHFEHGGDWKAATEALSAKGYGAPSDSDLMADLRRVDTVGRPAGGGEADLAPPDEADDDPDAAPGSSWRPTPLAPAVARVHAGHEIKPTIMRWLGGGDEALFYPGRINAIYGESGTGKTWIALCSAVERMREGERVAWIDLEEPVEGIVQRLFALGVDEELLHGHFMHFAPEESIKRGAAFYEALDGFGVRWAVIDSTGEALAVEGAGPNNDDEVAAWFQAWPRRWSKRWDTGALLLDHVVKDESNRGLFAGGSQRKRAAINGSAFMVEAIPNMPLGRGTKGALRLRVAKDRHGYWQQGRDAGRFVLDGKADPLKWWLEDAPGPPTEAQRLAPAMQRVSDFLARYPEEEFARSRICEPVKGDPNADWAGGKAADNRAAVDLLAEKGFIRRRKVAAGREVFRHLKPFQKSADDLPGTISCTGS